MLRPTKHASKHCPQTYTYYYCQPPQTSFSIPKNQIVIPYLKKQFESEIEMQKNHFANSEPKIATTL
jgi:hypothetical protein